MQPQQVTVWSDLQPVTAADAAVGDVGLVVVRWANGENVFTLWGSTGP
jgi:hypothetical protein